MMSSTKYIIRTLESSYGDEWFVNEGDHTHYGIYKAHNGEEYAHEYIGLFYDKEDAELFLKIKQSG